ncbi:Gfo/Idh/MocA family oxidoreductase [Kosakonia oryziphila]|uniref:Predicted dehydrogenase n=1 Tax=Kosakonia oryziphila TaxID=1005667 RepID=A0A1C4ESJ7_9ENTR|nr:Gfo/Idh/MocA family oxidoreductase [Kosakonia oryziphila]SCC46432.1 Predicted dehydrogenase [Kosakonia oryziphila]
MPHRTVSGPIRTALVGFGIAGKIFHAPLISHNADYLLAVIVSRDEQRVVSARQLYPQARIVSDWSSLLHLIDSGDIALDLIVLATPPGQHRDQALQASLRGIHLVVDKPFAPDVEAAEAMINAARQASTLLTVFHNRRWDGDFLTLKRLVQEEAFGMVRSFESRFEWWRPEGFGNWRDEVTIAQGGGLLLDLGSHLIDQAMQLFGQVQEASAELARHSGNLSDSDEDCFVSLLHKNGVRSRLWMNGQAALNAPRFHLLGSKRAFTHWGLDNQEPQLSAGMSPADSQYGVTPPERYARAGTTDEIDAVPLQRGDYPAFYQLLANALLHGGPPPVAAEEGLAVLRLIERLHRQNCVRIA